MSLEKRFGKTLLKILQGDITKQDAEAIVNAANSSLLGGGGVDGAIHQAGGPLIMAECKKIVARQGPLPTGEAVITSGGQMPSNHSFLQRDNCFCRQLRDCKFHGKLFLIVFA